MVWSDHTSFYIFCNITGIMHGVLTLNLRVNSRGEEEEEEEEELYEASLLS